MHLWQLAGLWFFGYLVAVLAARRAQGRRARLALAGSVVAFAILVFSWRVRQPTVLIDWLWPPIVLLLGYWTSGLLFVGPVTWQERALAWLDHRLDVRAIARGIPRAVAELLECAYVGVYPMVAIAFLLHLAFAAHPDPARFWAVILVTDFVCFGFLPWVQTRPPRALEAGEPWSASTRVLNLRLLGSTSIHANTFPSGHAAEALAAALLTLDAPMPIVVLMFAGAAAVSAGAVLGRYHYLADAVAGWVVALAVWAWVK
jgi:membrane-associated phospholipid phosphatase